MRDQDSPPTALPAPRTRAALAGPPTRAALPAPPARAALPAPKGSGSGGASGGGGQGAAPAPRGPKKRSIVLLLLGLALLFLAVLVIGALVRLHHKHALEKRAKEAAVPSVTVVRPGGEGVDTLILPGRLQAWNQAPVYARTSGYLRQWYVDIGQRVRAGQLLALIDTPEVDQQLLGARAALQTATAQEQLAAVSAARWNRLIEENAVSAQETDERRGTLATSIANRNQAVSEVNRLRALTDFKRIVAPFDGVVTSRSTDIGSLVVASTESAQPLFTIVDTSRLRLYISVPQSYAGRMRDGMLVRFVVPDHPHREFSAVIDRSSGAVDPVSGAMLLQLVYSNRTDELKPGAYAQVTFTFAPATENLDKGDGRGLQPAPLPVARIPASALLFRAEGTSVALVDGQGRVTMQRVSIETDYGSELAVQGVGPHDLVVDSPPDDIQTGERVHATLAKPGAKDSQAGGKGSAGSGNGADHGKGGSADQGKNKAKKSDDSNSGSGGNAGTITGKGDGADKGGGGQGGRAAVNPNVGINNGPDRGAAFGKNTGEGSDAGANADEAKGNKPPPDAGGGAAAKPGGKQG